MLATAQRFWREKEQYREQIFQEFALVGWRC